MGSRLRTRETAAPAYSPPTPARASRTASHGDLSIVLDLQTIRHQEPHDHGPAWAVLFSVYDAELNLFPLLVMTDRIGRMPERETIYTSFSPEAIVTLYSGDRIGLLSQIPTGSARLIVTSPPYNIGKRYEKRVGLATGVLV